MSQNPEQTYADLTKKRGVAYGADWKKSIADAAASFPCHLGIQVMDAERHIWAGELEEAAEIIARVLKEDPKHREARATSGVIAMQEGDLIKAQDIFESVLQEEPSNYVALFSLPSILIRLGMTEEAEQIQAQAQEYYADNPAFMAAVCSYSFSQAKYEDADQILEQFKDDPSDRFLMVRARQAYKNDDLIQAEAFSREAVARNPESLSGWEHLALILTQKGDLHEGKMAAQFALELNRRSTVALKQLANIARSNGDAAEASMLEEQLEKLGQRNKEHGEIRAATQLIRVRKYDVALRVLQPYLGSDDSRTRHMAANAILIVLRVHPQHERALEYISEVEAMGFGSAKFYATKSIVQMHHGDPMGAYKTISLGLELHPEDFFLRYAALRCYSIEGDKENLRAQAELIYDRGLTAPYQYLLVVSPLIGKGMGDIAEKFRTDLVKKFPRFKQIEVVDAMMDLNNGNMERGVSRFNEVYSDGTKTAPTFSAAKLFGLVVKLAWQASMHKLGFKKKALKDPDDRYLS